MSDRAPTVSQGIYGLTTHRDDVCPTPCEAEPRSMDLFVRSPAGTEIATVSSDGGGFYELALEVGSYQICTAFDRCSEFSVGAGEVVRRSYEMSAGPGWH